MLLDSNMDKGQVWKFYKDHNLNVIATTGAGLSNLYTSLTSQICLVNDGLNQCLLHASVSLTYITVMHCCHVGYYNGKGDVD